MARYVRKLRPDVTAVGESLLRLKRRADPAADRLLLRAMMAVMDADEVQAPEEVAFIAEVACYMDD